MKAGPFVALSLFFVLCPLFFFTLPSPCLRALFVCPSSHHASLVFHSSRSFYRVHTPLCTCRSVVLINPFLTRGFVFPQFSPVLSGTRGSGPAVHCGGGTIVLTKTHPSPSPSPSLLLSHTPSFLILSHPFSQKDSPPRHEQRL